MSNPSDEETQFIPQSGDEDTLWEAVAIVAENAKLYKIKWAGFDPATGKPWADSWVAKHDVTRDLVEAWRFYC
ncbi:hypothetical protein GYMLUDRAFT_464287 [Collybiopsis luxurians FD-317 M1]|uniref:Chromo domain-containing protein n=1 Tax=Collybiopsis luxurians FD-317 M1 TaxID=944289 RepID=A0A0D0C594_9AGAR|nr:hypothetical protein GYMLUDRAFT_464287 [Collybiopsis luxurians FD-317 M1]